MIAFLRKPLTDFGRIYVRNVILAQSLVLAFFLIWLPFTHAPFLAYVVFVGTYVLLSLSFWLAVKLDERKR